LIGAKRANINKLRTEYAVEVNLKEGQGEIRGIQVAVDAARRKLSSQIKELLDKAVDYLKVPQKFHSAIIGAGGNSVRKLQTRYGVRIMFPRSPKNWGSSDTDGADGPNKQDADEVVIMGNKEGVSKARAEIVALLEYEMEKSHTATVPVTSRAIEFVFKNAAKEIKQLREDSDIRIDIPQGNVREPDEKLTIKLRGTQDEVERAKTILSKIVKEAEKTISRTISVEKQYHRSLIGRGGM
jgi:predicted PilT family ATPase